jgi:hypothetical protein
MYRQQHDWLALSVKYFQSVVYGEVIKTKNEVEKFESFIEPDVLSVLTSTI